MPAQPRPTDGDTITIDNLLIGMPFIEFTPSVNGVPQQPVNLGVVDSAELAKELNEIALTSSQSGAQVALRKLINSIDLVFSVGVFNWAPAVQQFALGSSTLSEVVADAAAVVTDETVVSTADPEDYLGLANVALNSGSVTVTPTPVVAENVGTGNGSLGANFGDFEIDYPITLVSDLTSVTTTDPATGAVRIWSVVAVAAAVTGDEVEVDVSNTATNGELAFFVNNVGFNIPSGHTIAASYAPTQTLTEGVGANDDYIVDLKNGRIQIRHDAAKGVDTQLLPGQSVDVDYTYVEKSYTSLKPFTQTTFSGTARIRHLADVGINMIWDVPSASIAITDDALAFADDDFAVSNISVNVLDAGGVDRFGTIQLYSETQAAV
jgi:hypothetical protein